MHRHETKNWIAISGHNRYYVHMGSGAKAAASSCCSARPMEGGWVWSHIFGVQHMRSKIWSALAEIEPIATHGRSFSYTAHVSYPKSHVRPWPSLLSIGLAALGRSSTHSAVSEQLIREAAVETSWQLCSVAVVSAIKLCKCKAKIRYYTCSTSINTMKRLNM